jgi:nonsense-mediated mRNA decay protein 3
MCTAVARIGGDDLEQNFEVGIRIRFNNCPSCSRQSGDYYEAIIQLRIDGLLARDAAVELAEEHNLVLDMVDEHAQTDEKAFLTKKSPVKGGIDYYIGSITLGRAIAAKLRTRYGASVNEAPSIVGQKDGNDMYRNSILVKLPSLREGDVVALGGKLYVIESSDSKAAVLKNVRNGQITRVAPDDSRLKPVAKYRELKQAIVVSQDSSGVQVLDPDSMAAVTLSKPPYIKNIGESVSVVRYDDALHIV